MCDQDPTLGRLFEAARNAERAPNPERDRLRGAVAARLVGAGAMSASAAVASKAAAGALDVSGKEALLAAVKGKLVWWLALAVVGTVGAVVVARKSVTRDSHTSDARWASSVPTAAPNHPVQPTELSATALIVTVPLDEAQSAPAATHFAQAPTRAPSNHLAEELVMVRSAQSELAAGQPARVLALLEAYFRRFPAGVLVPEAKATQIKALCLAGQVEQANRQAARFESAHPDSPLAAHNKLRCATGAK